VPYIPRCLPSFNVKSRRKIQGIKPQYLKHRTDIIDRRVITSALQYFSASKRALPPKILTKGNASITIFAEPDAAHSMEIVRGAAIKIHSRENRPNLPALVLPIQVEQLLPPMDRQPPSESSLP